MPEVTLEVDVEQIVSAYLRGRTELTDLVDQRIYTELPKAVTFPLVVIHRPPVGENLTTPLHLVHSILDIHAYGGPKKVAFRIGATVRALLASVDFLGAHQIDSSPAGVITDVECGPFGWLPDPDFTPAKPRYLTTFDIYAHP